MHKSHGHTSTIDIPSWAEANQALEQSHRLFGHTLACWASDLLVLRRADLIRPTWPTTRHDDDSWSIAA